MKLVIGFFYLKKIEKINTYILLLLFLKMPSNKKKNRKKINKVISHERIPNALRRGILPDHVYLISVIPVIPKTSETFTNNLEEDPIDPNSESELNYGSVSGSALNIIRHLKNLK
jgi:hypothetical protein